MNLLETPFSTIKVHDQWGVLTIRIDRPEANNSINTALLEELMTVLHFAEQILATKVIVVEGLPGFFCTGMDFKAVNEGGVEGLMKDDPNGYYDLLKYFSLSSKIIVSKVEGKVNAGGIGIVAASDIVIADEKASFGLSEALFGLLPACVLPFLIRRVGFQKAQWMTLTTQGITAERAFQIGLVDEITNNSNETLRKNLLRLTRIEPATVKELKNYMAALWILDERTQEIAVEKIKSLMRSESVQNNIANFVNKGKFPWDKS